MNDHLREGRLFLYAHVRLLMDCLCVDMYVRMRMSVLYVI